MSFFCKSEIKLSRMCVQMASLIEPAVVIAVVGAAWTTSAQLSSLNTKQETISTDIASLKTSVDELKKCMADSNAELKKSMADSNAELKKSMADSNAELKKSMADSNAELSGVLAGVKLLGESAAEGIREAAAGATPVAAFVVATPAEVELWLSSIGLGQYTPRLAPLGGVNILLQTDASLKVLGVDLPDHRQKLLLEIQRVAARGSSRAAYGGGGGAAR